VLLFTGKGGVGKTTTAAATALRCADAGLRTIILSTDPAHSLADALDTPLGPLPSPVSDGLWGQQLDAQDRLEEAWGEIRAYLVDVLTWAGVAGIEAEELAVVPGLDEIFALADIRDHASSGAWDVVVVDCAPTAETLRLLSLPEVLAWYMARAFPASRALTRIVAPVLTRVSDVPVARDGVFAAALRVYERLDGVRELLTDPARTSVRLVVNPERVIVAEARRTHTYLALYGYGVDAVIANRLLPAAVDDPWFDRWRSAQAEHLADIDASFAPLPVLHAELADREVVGQGRLRALAAGLYGDVAPAARLHEGPVLSIEAHGEGVVLRLPLPGAARDDVDLGLGDGELHVRVGPYKRAVALPDVLRRRPVDDAALVDGHLQVRFGARIPAGVA
jgi:arsenite-transporting ATPase